ncbi:hypothetical protein PEL8287_03457 [Roseovarius litorisediminis]|uniref:DUF5681 domain-containing protein n=1 Tax=Roseovarius litorisediminis TaxID=1312363 RepID=A0A1Y5TGS6_9RHOB|nr:DUF5681 domain-containing protein [Roseovarius litorisediminis]SLN63403.1 hypothetical protein PEL8287_03457 [Roseovarius litorisediminis]
MTERKNPDVGYMNPPEHTRFKKGKSGNPRGRPRKREDLNTVLNRVLNRKIRIKDDGRKMPLRDALIWKLRELALQGDKQALALQRRIIDESGIADPNAYSPEEAKQRMIRALVAMGAKVVKSKGDT